MYSIRKKTAVLMFTLTIVFITASLLLGVASADKQEEINWKSNTKNKEIKEPSGINGNSDWSSETFISADKNEENSGKQSEDQSSTNPTLPILAGIAGVLGLALITGKSRKHIKSILPKGNGIWVPEADRQFVIDMINKASSRKFLIDNKEFIKETDEPEDPSKSKTFSDLVSSLINGDKFVVIGTDTGWLKYDEQNGNTEWVEFEGNNSGIAIGGNNTDQVIVVSGKDNEMKDISGNAIYSGSEMALVHEIIHAARGVSGLKSVNEDEEAHAIKLENIIRNELGYGLRGDGDASDDVNSDDIPDGDESYGRYTNQDKGDIQSPVYSHYEGTSVESGEEYLTVLAEQYGADCTWYEPSNNYPKGYAKVSLNGKVKYYYPTQSKVVNDKIVVNANDFRYAFDIDLYEGEAYLRKLVNSYSDYVAWSDWNELTDTCTVYSKKNPNFYKVYKAGENGVRIENDRMIVNKNEFLYDFDIGLQSDEAYLRKLVEKAGGTIEWRESENAAIVRVGNVEKVIHIPYRNSYINENGEYTTYETKLFVNDGHIVISKELFNIYFYGHQNIYPKVEDGKIKFYYQNGELAFTPKYTINPNIDYVKVDHDILEEYIRSILCLSSSECYIENSFDNLSVKDLYSYNWNGEAYEYKVPELILVIHGEKFTIPFSPDIFYFDQNGNMYFSKYSAGIYSTLFFFLESGYNGSYADFHRNNNGYCRVMDYLTYTLGIPNDSIEYSDGTFKIDGKELNIDNITITSDFDIERNFWGEPREINDVYAKAYEIYKEIERVAKEYITTHWVESYGKHIDGLGHQKVLIERFNKEYSDTPYGINTCKWYDTGEYVDYLSGCPDCNPKAVNIDDYINKYYNISEITQKKYVAHVYYRALFTSDYYPYYYLDTELKFPGMYGLDNYNGTSSVYADSDVIDQVIRNAMENRPSLGKLNLSVPSNSCFEGEEISIIADCQNAHHIYVRVVDENGNTVYQSTEIGTRVEKTIKMEKGGIYKVYAAANNSEGTDLIEITTPKTVTVKFSPELKIVNVHDNEIEVLPTFPVSGESTNKLLIRNSASQSWTEVASGVKNSKSQLIQDLTSGTNYAICMRWVENGVQMEKTVEVETPVTKSSGKYGDLNADGKINSTDYAILKRYILGTIDKLPVTDGSYIADLNADGRINSTDYTLLKRYLLSPESTVFPAEKFLSETPYVKLTNLKNNEIYVAIPQDDGSKAINIIGEGTNCHHIGLFIGNSKGTETLKDIQYNSRLNDTLEYEYIFPVSDSGTYSIYLAGRNAHDGIKTSTLDKSETVSINVIVPGSKSTILEQAQNDLITVKSLSPQIDLGTSGADGLWGPNTAASILAFQQWCVQEWASYNNTSLKDANKHLENVKATGLLDRATLIALRIQAEKHKNMTITNNPYNIQENVYSQYVEMAQKYLEALNEVRFTNLFDLGPQGIDGKWSPGGYTYTAIKLFQKEYGLPETGILDKTTFTELSNAGKEALKFVAASKIPPSLSLYSGTTITMYDMNGAAHVVKNNIDDISYAICYNYWGFTPLNTGSYTQALRNYYNSSVSGFTSFEAWLAEKYNLVDTNTPTPFKYYYENVWGKDIIYPTYTEWIKLFGYIIDSPPEVPDPIEPESGSENIETLNKVLDVIQTILDVVGFFPGIGDVADGINVGICLLRKDLLGAVFSGIALIPAIGSVIAAPLKTIFKAAGNVPQIKAAINILAKVFGGANKVVDGLTSALNTVKGLIKGIPDLVESLIHNSFIRNLIGSDGVQAILAMAKVIRNKIDDLVGKTDEVVTAVKNIIRGSVHGLEQLMLKILEGTETVFEVVRETLELQDGSLMLKFLDGAETIITKAELQAAMIAKGMGDKLDEVWQLCKVGCFSGDTLVFTKEGPKRIDEIKEGELVYSKNVNTGDFDYKKVLQVYIKSSKEFIRLKFEDEDIRTTPTHPFFVEEGWWKTAQNIKQGDRIVTASGQLKEVLAIEIEILSEPERIYNLNVEDYHTYFVGASGLLVHNMCTPEMTGYINDLPKILDEAGNRIPYGFKSLDEYKDFISNLKKGLPEDTKIVFQGSSVTGVSHETGAIFDYGRVSDFDIGLVQDDIILRALEADSSLGFKMKTDPTRIGPLNEIQLDYLGLKSVADSMSEQAGREVGFMLFDSLSEALRRPSIYVE